MRRALRRCYLFRLQNPITIARAGESSLNHGDRGSRTHSSILLPIPFLRRVSSSVREHVPWQCSGPEVLSARLRAAIDARRPDEAWDSFSDYKRLHGFPERNTVSRLIIALSCSSKRHWLRKACELVVVLLHEKPELLHYDSLSRLTLSLARAQIPVQASVILRVMLERDISASVDVWVMIVFHMVRSEIGSCLAANLLMELCERFLSQSKDVRNAKREALIKPTTALFNLVLSSCARFGSILKALQIIDMIPQIGVVANANTIVIIACIYDINGQREDLRNLEKHIQFISSSSLCGHYQQFYDCLLKQHFNFNDLDAAANLMLGRLVHSRSIRSYSHSTNKNFELQVPCQIQVGSSNLKTGYRMMAKPEQLQDDFVFDAPNQYGLVLFENGRLVPSMKAFIKLIIGYVRDQRHQELSSFLVSICKEKVFSEENKLISELINACSELGWLETSHDILDCIESTEIVVEYGTYKSLFRAYCIENRLQEAQILLKQMRKKSLFVNMPKEEAMEFNFQKVIANKTKHTYSANVVKKSSMVELVERERKEDIQACQLINELNSAICFFCRAKMLEEAMKTYRKMCGMNVQSNLQTFNHLVNGYSSLNMYREITIIWGEIKRQLEDGILSPHRDLLDYLLWNFIRGGYFERVMEIINYMRDHNMFIDKWKCRREFLKLHRALYQNLKASSASTDAQKKRLEYVQAFRTWAHIGVKSYKDLDDQ